MKKKTDRQDEGSTVIDVARIDHWAASGTGPFHRASVMSKMLFLLFVVAAAVTARSPYPLMAGYAGILLAAVLAGLPWVRMAALSLYAVVFAVLYGISLRGGWWLFALLIFKAITPSLAMLTLVVTTPYPKIFSFLSAALPEILAAGLFMTYRTLFILLDMMDNFVAAIRLRGGFSPGSLAKNSSNLAKGIGMLLVKAVERASRLYAVMAVRGYSGSMAQIGGGSFHREDYLPIGAGGMVLVIALVWR
jgi:energy-coupling factor transporter transmembrane protein EcfT